ncbi:hypothetical protein V6N13_013913 [Hibiscus sabdariffa]|uniref:Uncharacterized protein n=1 Tax=Hibiscus sabdariffa TaxID=183260 RepID=A0ABR2RU01_9ROSI
MKYNGKQWEKRKGVIGFEANMNAFSLISKTPIRSPHSSGRNRFNKMGFTVKEDYLRQGSFYLASERI